MDNNNADAVKDGIHVHCAPSTSKESVAVSASSRSSTLSTTLTYWLGDLFGRNCGELEQQAIVRAQHHDRIVANLRHGAIVLFADVVQSNTLI
ncbi:hypothetical protein AAVH_01822 [Aphelenchoides avenae]|nr:hypothetical protein AAVH_01822 [Aphelenchus avenae]